MELIVGTLWEDLCDRPNEKNDELLFVFLGGSGVGGG